MITRAVLQGLGRGAIAVACIFSVAARAAAGDREKLYAQKDRLLVTVGEEVASILPCERIPLEWESTKWRAEACMGRSRNGDIWAALRPEAVLVHSSDGGKTWSRRPLLAGESFAFTVLRDDTLVNAYGGQVAMQIARSTDLGKSWSEPLSIKPVEPYELIGSGFHSFTQISDGTVLFPVDSYRHRGDREKFICSVFRSTDRARTWTDPAPTWNGCCESQILELASGKLLMATRYQPAKQDAPDEWKELVKTAFMADSKDGGRTWTGLRPVCDAEGKPLLVFGECHGQLVQVPDRRVVFVYDHRYPYENYQVLARVSEDEGKTWGREVYRVSFGNGYPASVVLEDGTIVTVTGNSPFDSAPEKGPYTAQAIRWNLPARIGN